MKFATLVLLSGVTASAHHSLDGTYDLKREVELKGTLRRVLLRNPHSFLQIEVASKDGNIERWSLEFPNGTNSLRKQGIEAGTLGIGDQITVVVNPPRKPGTAGGLLVSMHRTADEFEWSAKIKQKQR